MRIGAQYPLRAGKAVAVIALLLIAALLATACTPAPSNPFEDEELSYSNMVHNVRTVHKLTGSDALVDTTAWRVGGTDLGIPIYSQKNDVMLLAFGDTFDNNVTMTGLWRSNVMGFSSDFDLSDGLEIEDFLKNPTGIAKPVIDGKHTDNREVTKIPTGGIEIGGTIYMFYMSVRSWGAAGSWVCNYNGAVKSTDGGATWERVFDLTWVRTDSGTIAEQTLTLANDGVSLADQRGSVTLEGRVAPYFMQIFPVDGLDGYIYLYGITEGRGAGLKLARVAAESFECFSEYEYFTGLDDESQPIFVKGCAGLSQLGEVDTGNIMPYAIAEPSVMYNEYLEQWMLVYFAGGKIGFRTSDNPWGGWSNYEVLITDSEYAMLYGGFVHSKYTAQQGKIFYFILSQWMPTYNTFLIEVVLN